MTKVEKILLVALFFLAVMVTFNNYLIHHMEDQLDVLVEAVE